MAYATTTRAGVPHGAIRQTGRELILAGAAVGVGGGLLMAAWLIASAALNDRPPLAQLRAIGATFVPQVPAEVGPGLFVYGLLLHLAVSALLGILFVAMLPRGFPPVSASVAGVGYAWVVMAITTSVILPLVNAEMRAQMRTLGGAWVIAHGLYGLVLGFGPWLRTRLGRERVLARAS
jgi:hypothetical protein